MYIHMYIHVQHILRIIFWENTVYIDGSGGMRPQEDKFLGYIT